MLVRRNDGVVARAYNIARRVNWPAVAKYTAGPLASYGAYKLAYPTKALVPKIPLYQRRKPLPLLKKVKTKGKGKSTLTKQVRNLSKIAKANMGTLIYRKRTTERLLSSVNEKGYGVAGGDITMSSFETVLGELRFFNPSAPGTLIQGSGASGTYQRSYLFKSVSGKLVAKNNYQVPCRFTVTVCSAKEDTSINPATAFQNGLVDAGNPSSQSQRTYWTDSAEFQRLWKIEKTVRKVLEPGRMMQCSHVVRNVMYDPAIFDSHAQAYQKKNKCWCFLIKVEGLIGHDTSADQQGMTQVGVDIVCDYTYVVEYDAGIDLKYIVVSDGSDTFTNGAVVSSKPVSDNIGYSVA